MKFILLLSLITLGSASVAQYPVNVCITPTQITPALINAVNIYYDNCVEFPTGQNFTFLGTSNKDIRVTNSVKIKPGFKAGNYSSNGKLKISILKPTNLEVASMNYSNLLSISKLEKFELGIRLPSDIETKVSNFINRIPNTTKLNPFLDWELDADAVFTHVETGTVKRIEGFYYDEYQRDASNDSWQKLSTDYRIRFRFAPPLTGKWTCIIYLKINGSSHSQTMEFPFSVVNSSDNGYVTVHSNKKNLQRNGRIVLPVGVNFSTPVKGNNVYPATGYTDNATTLNNWLEYHNDIDEYRQQGGKYIRTLQTGWASLLEFVDKGDYSRRMHYAWEQDRLIDYCEIYDIQIQFNLMQQEPFMKYANFYLDHWDWSNYSDSGEWTGNINNPPYCYSDGNGNFKEPYETFLLENDLKYHEQRTRYYIARYGYSTSIYMWELLSEPFHLNQAWPLPEVYNDDTPLGANVRNALTNYHNRIANYIKVTLGHTEQLIGVAVLNVFPENMDKLDASVTNPNVDVITTNTYADSPDKLVISKLSGENNIINSTQENGENTYFRTVSALRLAAGKPIMISEYGAGYDSEECNAYSQHKIDMMTVGFSGVAGFNAWIGGFNDQESTWGIVIRSKDHMNSDGVILPLSHMTGSWVQGREEVSYLDVGEELKEQQYYISSSKEKAAGYVRNRTYNTSTTTTVSSPKCDQIVADWNSNFKNLNNIPWDRNKLTIQGLKPNTDYLIDWYRAENYMSSYCFNTNSNGEHKLIHPQLYVHPDALSAGYPFTPVAWYVIQQYNCQQGLDLVDQSFERNYKDLTMIDLNYDTVVPSVITENYFKLSPNPTNSILEIESSGLIEELVITNSLNQVMIRLNSCEYKVLVDLSHLVAGTYFVIPKNGVVYKIVKT
jgi:hypothetical protein